MRKHILQERRRLAAELLDKKIFLLYGQRPPCPDRHEPEELRKKVAVVGTRTFNNRLLLKKEMDYYTFNLIDPIIVVGEEVYGVGQVAIWWAGWNWYVYRAYPPSSRLPSPQRYHVRNRKVVEDADFLVAFRCKHGVSDGTDSTIELARKKGIPIRIVRYK
jgi:hypothetical protein